MCPEWTLRIWRARVDSNHRPSAPQADALSTELRARLKRVVYQVWVLPFQLEAAATVCAPAERDSWLARQKERCKSGQIHEVMEALKPYLHVKTSEDKQPAQAAYLYIKNRPGQFNYPDAIAKELPIGSGEVESAHRYVIQKRLKLPGAWWREDHAQNLLKLRTMRANHRWDDYWNKKAA